MAARCFAHGPNTTVAFDVVFYNVKSLRRPGGFVAIVTMREYREL